jgi:iron complex outermembrane receptor protein
MRKNRNRLAQAIRMALALGSLGLGLAATPASAQSVTALTREDLQRTGLTSLGDILQHLTVSGPAANTGFNSGGNGETRIDLRNLGSQRTLVLVNGRRWIGTAQTLDGAVDLNTIPLAIVDRVEILLEGASAIYGSDAIAGVVNIITRKGYEGGEGAAYIGQNQEGDGRVESYDYTIGAKSERASLTANASYVKQEPILAGDRKISATPTANVPGNNSNINASSTTPFGRFFRTSNFGDSVTFDPVTGGYRPYDGNVDGFNYAPDNYISTPQERTSLYVQAATS